MKFKLGDRLILSDYGVDQGILRLVHRRSGQKPTGTVKGTARQADCVRVQVDNGGGLCTYHESFWDRLKEQPS